MVSQSVSHVSNTVNINIESVLSGQPRGLSIFISEIRACKTKEEELTRVDAELGFHPLLYSIISTYFNLETME